LEKIDKVQLKESYLEFTVLLKYFESLSLLFVRLALAYGFYTPALLKWSNFDSTVEWFSSLGIPFSSFSVFLVASLETVTVLLLFFGLFIRLFSMPLMFVMFIAIVSVHLVNGFAVENNGFEIPLYYLLFLGILGAHGAGKFSLDYLLYSKKK